MIKTNAILKKVTFIITLILSIISSISIVIIDNKYLNSSSQQYILSSKYPSIFFYSIVGIVAIYILLQIVFGSKYTSNNILVSNKFALILGIIFVCISIFVILNSIFFSPIKSKNDSTIYVIFYVVDILLFAISGIILILYKTVLNKKINLLLIIPIAPVVFVIVNFLSSHYTVNDKSRIICCFAFVMFALLLSFILKDYQTNQSSKFTFMISQVAIIASITSIVRDFNNFVVLKSNYSYFCALDLFLIPVVIFSIYYSISSIKNT